MHHHNYGTNANWNRAFWAPRSDKPLCTCAIITRGVVAVIIPPVCGDEDLAAMLTGLKDRVERPYLARGQRRHQKKVVAPALTVVYNSDSGEAGE